MPREQLGRLYVHFPPTQRCGNITYKRTGDHNLTAITLGIRLNLSLLILSYLSSAPDVKMWTKTVSKSDMTALRDISDEAIAENLKERLNAGIIYVSGFDVESLYHYRTAIAKRICCCW